MVCIGNSRIIRNTFSRLFFLCVGLMLFGSFAGCESSGASAGPKKRFDGHYPIKVVCTTGMVADLVRNVAGIHVDVVQLMEDGVDPHLYKARPGDVSRLSQADIIFYSGLHLEGKLADIFVRMARRKPTYAVTEQIDESRLLEFHDDFFDPHLWFDVSLWSETVNVVVEAMQQFDPAHAEEYRTNAELYRSQLAELHENCKTRIATIPEKQRVLVTAHDAFHYFGRAYGMEVKAIQGVSTESEAGVKKINELVDFLVKRNIKAVFVETSVPERNIRSLIEGCQARNHTVIIGGELFSDAMGKPGTPEGTYVGMIHHNVETIVKALK
ncbi:MAG: zinc ABC transporter substrate-binding protein [Planctomycetes bacterium]|nr:zinc ABC transporter substrate-binding protein [Planctomycetota bacterium]